MHNKRFERALYQQASLFCWQSALKLHVRSNMVTLMRPLLATLVLFLIAGCASTEMSSYTGQDIREVMLTNGQPIGVVDMGNGVRAFQFMWGGTNTTTVSSQVTTNADLSGSDGWFRKGEIKSAGSALVSNGCVVAYLTKWDEQRQAWIVYDYRIPKKLIC